jgi:hypothetical protein
MRVRLARAVVGRHNGGDAVYLLPQVIPDVPLQLRRVLQGRHTPLIQHGIELGISNAWHVDRRRGFRVIR